MYYVIKVLVSAALIVLVSEISKRSTILGAVLASIPLVSFLAILWIYLETKDTARIATLSTEIFWLVLPSLVFFILFPVLLKRAMNFYIAFAISTLVMVGCYFITHWLIKLK